MPDLFQILTTVAVGAGATLITLRVSMGKLETQLEASNVRIKDSEIRSAEAMNAFRVEAAELRKAITELTRIVDKQAVFVDGIEDIYDRLKTVEIKVAVLEEARKHP